MLMLFAMVELEGAPLETTQTAGHFLLEHPLPSL